MRSHARWLTMAGMVLLTLGPPTAGAYDPPRAPVLARAAVVRGGVELRWRNPALRISGVPVGDLFGVEIRRNGSLLRQLVRSPGSVGESDSFVDTEIPDDSDTWSIRAFELVDSLEISQSTPLIRLPEAGARFLHTPDSIGLVLAVSDSPAVQTLYLANAGLDSLTIQAVPLADWLTVAPAAVTGPAGILIPPHAEQALHLKIDPSGLASGSYRTVLRLLSNDPDRPGIRLDVVLRVVDVRVEATLTPDSLLVFPGFFESARLSIRNVGPDAFGFEARALVPWIKNLPVTRSLSPGGRYDQTVPIQAPSAEPGRHTGLIRVTTDGPRPVTLEIPLTVNVAQPMPRVRLLADSVVARGLVAGQPVEKFLALVNDGIGPLDLRAASEASWIQLRGSDNVVQQGKDHQITLTFRVVGLPAGTHRTRIIIESNDPIRPRIEVPVIAFVDASGVSLDSDRISHVTPWGGIAATASVQIRNVGTGALVLQDPREDPPVSWLGLTNALSTLEPGSVGSLSFRFSPGILDVGTYSTTIIIPTNDIGRPAVRIEAHLDVTRVVSSLSVDPAHPSISIVDGAPVQGIELWLENDGSDYMHVTMSDELAWFRASPAHLVLRPGERRSASVLLSGTGPGPGEHLARLTVETDVPEQAPVHLHLPVHVAPARPAVDLDVVGIGEVGFGCVTAQDSPRVAQFIELAAFGGQLATPRLLLEVDDRSGSRLFVTSVSLPSSWQSTGWPSGATWLVGGSGLGPTAGVGGDATLSGRLDPIGGILTVREENGSGRILHRFAYGAAGGAPLPGMSESLARAGIGEVLVSTPTPTNSLGVTGRSPRCHSPVNRLTVNGVTLESMEPRATLPPPIQQTSGSASYDLTTGYIGAAARNHALAITTEVYYLTGADAGRPVQCEAVMSLVGSIAGGSNMYARGSAQATLQWDNGEPARISRSGNGHIEIRDPLTVPITISSGTPFQVTMSAEGGGELHGGSGGMTGRLTFLNLPPGSRIEGNHGHVVPGPDLPPLFVVESSAEYGQNQVRWSTGLLDQLMVVERRVGDGPWLALRALDSDEEGFINLVDPTVAVGESYSYGLLIGGRRVGVATVQAAAPAMSSLGSIHPNPIRGDLVAPVLLSGNGPARIELFDPAGRRLVDIDLSGWVGGEHNVLLREQGSLSSGIYFVRFTTGETVVSSKVIVLR